MSNAIDTCNGKQYQKDTETSLFGLKVVREYLGKDEDGEVKKGSVIVLEGKLDHRLQDGLGAINKKARGWWLAIPAVITAVVGVFELLTAAAVFLHAAGTYTFCDLEESTKHGDVRLQMSIAGILFKNGLINSVSGVLEMLPFVGAEVARYVGKKQGWQLPEKAPILVTPTQMSFLDMTVERPVTQEEKNGQMVSKRGSINPVKETGERYEAIKQFLVSGTQRKNGKQAFSGAKGWWLAIPGALVAILGVGEVLIGVAKMLYPIGVLACCGITKCNSRNHSECGLHAKLGWMLFKRGIGDLLIGLRLMVPKHGARTARKIYKEQIDSGKWKEPAEKLVIQSKSESPVPIQNDNNNNNKEESINLPGSRLVAGSDKKVVPDLSKKGSLLRQEELGLSLDQHRHKPIRHGLERVVNMMLGDGLRTNKELNWDKELIEVPVNPPKMANHNGPKKQGVLSNLFHGTIKGREKIKNFFLYGQMKSDHKLAAEQLQEKKEDIQPAEEIEVSFSSVNKTDDLSNDLDNMIIDASVL